VSFAGPLSNLLLALAAATGLGVFFTSLSDPAKQLLQLAFFMNLGLFVFNLLPIPGLDGSRLLPASLDGWQRRNEKYTGAVLLVIVAVPAISSVLLGVPIRFLAKLILGVFGLHLP
jgi:Zn-dependent protease